MITSERDLAFYLKGFFDIHGEQNITRSQQTLILEKIKELQKQNPSDFSKNLEALIESPSSIKKLVDVYFLEVEAKDSTSVSSRLKNIQVGIYKFAQDILPGEA